MQKSLNEKLIQHLSDYWRKCGVSVGDLLLVHSSLKRLIKKINQEWQVIVTPDIIYESLMSAVGYTEGTLIFPLFNFDFPKTRFFDIRNTPSQMGALSELSRNFNDSVRTGHPIYSFSVRGKHANFFESINNVSGYGSDSPFAKIKELDGKIAVIGLSDQDSMTSYHFVEEQNQVSYRYYKDFKGNYVNKMGEESTCTYSLYVRDLENGIITDVNRMMDRLWSKGLYKGEKFYEGYGMRTIKFNEFYEEVDYVIKSGLAIDYLFSKNK